MSKLLILNDDTIIDYLFPLLSATDIIHFGETCKLFHLYSENPIVWQRIVYSTFHIPELRLLIQSLSLPVSEKTKASVINWKKFYIQLSSAGIFTWGQDGPHRLGINIAQVPTAFRTNSFSAGVCIPIQIESLPDNKVPIQILAGGFSVIVQSSDNFLYALGILNQHRQFNQIPRYANNNVNSKFNPGFKSLYQKLSTKINNRKIIKFSVGRSHLLGIDQDNYLWLWNVNFNIPAYYIKFNLSRENYQIKNFAAGWNFTAVYVPREGILITKADPEISYPPDRIYNFDRINISNNDSSSKSENQIQNFPVASDRNGTYPIFPDGNGILIPHDIIPHTDGTGSLEIVSMDAGEDYLIFVNKRGDVYKVDCYSSPSLQDCIPVRLKNFSTFLDQNTDYNTNPLLSEGDKIVSVTCSYKNFALLSLKGKAFFGNRHDTLENSNPITYQEFDNKQLINIALGDYHYLALTLTGEVYAWGTEPRRSGAFGLGPPEILMSLGAIEINRDLILKKPTKLDLPNESLVVGLTACGWHSGAIILNDKSKFLA